MCVSPSYEDIGSKVQTKTIYHVTCLSSDVQVKRDWNIFITKILNPCSRCSLQKLIFASFPIRTHHSDVVRQMVRLGFFLPPYRGTRIQTHVMSVSGVAPD